MELTKNLMTKTLITMAPDNTIMEAHSIMKENEIRHIPIMSNENKLVGIISNRDVQKAMVIKKLNQFNQEIIVPEHYKIADFMSWPVITVSENTHVKLVAEVLLIEKISSVVVVDDKSNVTGIVTVKDILTFIVNMIDNMEKPHHWTLAYYLSR